MGNILGVKIRHKVSGLYVLRDGRLSKNGKTYSTLGFAKTHITNNVRYRGIDKYKNYEFVIFKDDCTIEVVPVKEHLIDLFKRRLKDAEDFVEYYKSRGYSTEYREKEIARFKEILNELMEWE